MNRKYLLATAAVVAALGAAPVFAADVGKAASEATEATKQKIDQKRAEQQAKESGPVGEVVNKGKAMYHEKKSENAAENAKDALKKKD